MGAVAASLVGISAGVHNSTEAGAARTSTPGEGPGNADYTKAKSIYDFTALDIDGKLVSLEKYQGNVAIIVNVASQWGKTDTNYKQLVQLYDKYAESGLKILAFPCNQFGSQEPGTPEDIKKFAASYGVRFDLFAKIDVNGSGAHPLWNYLKSKQGSFFGSFIKWNFTKFIIDKNGQPVSRYEITSDPLDMEPELQKYLNQ